MKRRNWRKK